MPHRHGPSVGNPLAGVYFAIYASILVGGLVMLAIFEQLGAASETLKAAMAGIAVLLFATIGVSGYTTRVREFLMSGRRVPAFYNGASLAIVAPGGAGIAGISGALFLTGFDSLCIGLGLVAGLTVSVLLVAPYLRKFGAPTVPAYLGARFDSGPVRLLAASVSAVPLVLLAIAEIKIALVAAGWLVSASPSMLVPAIVLVLLVTLLPGGVRSLSWSGAAQALAVLMAIVLPAMVAAVMETNLPFGQFSHGPVLRAVGRAEATQGFPVAVADLLALELPGNGMQPLLGRFATVFGSVGPLAFVLLTFSIIAGVAGSPSLLSRAVTTPSVYDTRKSIGWAVVLLGLLLMTFSSIAVFERSIIMEQFTGATNVSLQPGLQRLIELGYATIPRNEARLAVTSIYFDRDSMLLALPVLMGMPQAVVNLIAAGILAAGLAGAGLAVTQIAVIVGEDVIQGPANRLEGEAQRLLVCRLAMIGAGLLAGTGALLADGDPLQLLLSALAISGSALFPVLALSIWWKRMTAAGALAGLAAGFGVALVMMALSGVIKLGIPAVLAPALAIPVAVVAILVVSHLTPAPGRHSLEMVRDLRIPGGEAIYDREARQARQRTGRPR